MMTTPSAVIGNSGAHGRTGARLHRAAQMPIRFTSSSVSPSDRWNSTARGDASRPPGQGRVRCATFIDEDYTLARILVFSCSASLVFLPSRSIRVPRFQLPRVNNLFPFRKEMPLGIVIQATKNDVGFLQLVDSGLQSHYCALEMARFLIFKSTMEIVHVSPATVFHVRQALTVED